MTPLSILQSARERLAEPERWLHSPDFWAVDADGNETSPRSPATARYALIGAIYAAHDNTRPGQGNGAIALALIACVIQRFPADHVSLPMAISLWHDAPERTHAEVLAVLDKAIQMAKEGA